ncbi:MAG: succinylglutamate desuccinylase/aspartoacylase family protein [Pseudomonadota bacterium]
MRAAFIFVILSLLSLPSHADSPAPLPSIGGLIGDIQIRKTIDVNTLSRGAVHRFYIPAGRMPTGQDWLVPVVVIRGAQDGPRFLVTAGVHGDELNGIGAAHKLIDEITPAALSGTLTIVPGVNVPGLLAATRNYPFVNGTGAGTNLNRVMPGDTSSTDAGVRYAGKVWQGIIANNADFAVDLHTQSTGTAYPLYVFADIRKKSVEEMARLLGPEMIKIDSGQEGTVETALNKAGVPAVTFEIGAANVFQNDLIETSVIGLKRLMAAKGMLTKADIPAPKTEPIVGNDTVGVNAEVAGIVIRMKELLDSVTEGDVIAETRDGFGRILYQYRAPVDGHVAAIATDPFREEGSLIIRILTMNKSRSCKYGC